MKFLIDTNICSAHMRRPARLAHRFIQHVGQRAIPTVVLGELYAGAYRHSQPPRLLSLIEDLLSEMVVLDFDSACAKTFGQIRAELLKRGMPVSSIDLMIASVALVNDLTVVTHNVADFRNVPELRIEDWIDS
jgi:tRNA(fMet)-specific endonuclease VapC